MIDPDLILVPLGISLIILSFGASLAMVKWASWRFDTRTARQSGLSERLLTGADVTQQERAKALEAYRQLASEKLEVIKTAIALGYNDRELQQLDKRLESLIGSEALKCVIRGESPLPPADLDKHDLEAELRELRQTTQV
jgi:hypothetical protein